MQQHCPLATARVTDDVHRLQAVGQVEALVTGAVVDREHRPAQLDLLRGGGDEQGPQDDHDADADRRELNRLQPGLDELAADELAFNHEALPIGNAIARFRLLGLEDETAEPVEQG